MKGIRARITGVAAGVVLLVLVVASAGLLTFVRTSLRNTAETTAVTRARDLAALASAGRIPAVLATTQGVSAQIIGPDGTVLASTGEIEGEPAILTTRPPAGSEMVTQVATLHPAESGSAGPEGQANHESNNQNGEHSESDGPFLVVAVGFNTPTGTGTAITAVSLAPVNGAVSTLVPALAVGVPALTMAVAVLVWFLVGVALRPVTAMSERAEQITVTDLATRLPVPAGEDEIHGLAVTLNRMLDRLERAVRRQRRFVADASHELRSPVSSILTMAEVAGAAPESVDAKTLADDVAYEARRMSKLVEDLLALARSDEMSLSLMAQDVDLDELVREEARRVDADVEVDASAVRPVRVHGDPLRLAQVLRNLLDNAARHARSMIHVELSEDGGRARLLVADDGEGVPEEDRERIFERFVRLDEARGRDRGGSGLGLAVTRAIVEAHGGSVRVIDDPRFAGAVFEVTMPTGTEHLRSAVPARKDQSSSGSS